MPAIQGSAPGGGGGGLTDDDLTDIAAIADQQGDLIIRGTTGWERLAKSSTATDVLQAGATKPQWGAAPSGATDPGRAKASGGTVYLGCPGGAHLGTATAVATVSGGIFYWPFLVVEQIVVDAVFATCQASQPAAAVRFGFYNADTDLQPTTLVSGGDLGTVDFSSNGVKSITGLSVTLAPGRYLGCALMNNSSCGIYGMAVAVPGMQASNPADPTQQIIRMSGSLAYGALPSTGQTWATATVGSTFQQHFFLMRWTP